MTGTDMALRLGVNALATIVAWQRAAGQREICGLCAIDGRGVQRVLPLTNHAGLFGEFEVSRSEEAVVRSAAAQRDWEVVAFVHTHPHHAPEMSPRDARCFERDALPWVIVGTLTAHPYQRVYGRPVGRVS